MEIMYVIVFLILIGYFSRHFKILDEKDRMVLNKIVIYIAMPSTIFLSLIKNVTPADLPEFMKLPFIILISTLICAILAYFVGKRLKLDNKSLGGFILVSSVGNTGFLGYPVILGFYGTEGLLRAIFCDMAAIFVSMFLGTYIGVRVSGIKKNVMLEVITFPPLLTAILSVLLVLINFELSNLPKFMVMSLEYMSNATIPLIMLSLGLSLSPKAAKFGLTYGILASIFRMVISPLIAFPISESLLSNQLDKQVAVMQSAMPSAMMPLVFAVIYDLDVKLVASACFISTVISLGVLPIIYMLI
ncbi:Auxin Efflux Carrier [Methanococcus vannielii SB]|uniref:Auxin Efflux Carrier n=1 Tax=Methanococcus vannielii (strain ATCC 35089 / DSM 1224 / JCM 13029 / OCM 148 / SB) TaxID=406327 RepID=A6UPA3_METVS|nr:AEC family transporter [Methanococcus vannielii]ABR54325.1 Auxin Efflux Carrier [Methanococcus vannielii SB]